ncbi:MAG: transcription-repair coupling factor [Chloroflexia bacterium]|nr:transcription-repair coupling factor [Chloroflexia bacterium]
MPPDPAIVAQRLSLLQFLSHRPADHRRPSLIVTTARALLQPTLTPEEFAQAHQVVEPGTTFSMRESLQRWLEWGYRSTRLVEEPGEFARRGGIVDVYPPTEALPLRIELFGDEVDSIRQFDPQSQRSCRQVARLTLSAPYQSPWWQRQRAIAYLKQAPQESLRPEVATELERDLHYLQQGTYFEGWALYAPLFQQQLGCLLDHLPPNLLLVLDEPEQVEAAMREYTARTAALRQELIEAGELPADFPLPYLDAAALSARLAGRDQLALSTVQTAAAVVSQIGSQPTPTATSLTLPFAPVPHYGGRIKEVLANVAKRQKEGQHTVIVSHQCARLKELLQEQGHSPDPQSLELLPGRLPSGGWACPEANLTILSDTEIFGWAPPRRRALVRRRQPQIAREDLLQRLHVGDHVVHEDHGIAVYEGLVHLTLADGVPREYLHLRYAAQDRLYVPVDRVDRVRRYIGAGDRPPALQRLGTADWERIKNRVRQAVADMAQELLELYAAREVARGHAFAPDSDWQRELEAAFPYIETEDQLRAVTEVKKDMEQVQPMDRLVCGDVGYGKTEVALRAAFKAVLDGKQVAVLVPTTVLAMQHYRTFQERLESFPLRLEMLSRFRRPHEQKKIVADLGEGTIDIVIGTHRLLSKDVRFKDLGLVIVDEEQRFGVRHKEHLKKLRREVDVLTLTATPIPRTLHMALSGLRDLSVIETPPEERVPIRTYVVPREDKLIRSAILRELDRGGQVYFVHNRVRSIYRVMRVLQELVPEARFAVGHGQLPERELEQVMLDFVAGHYDVLVCTTIIESGLDIPNVNTILIDKSVMMGLAQLYQLRGRVGRGAVRAYAYLLYNPQQELQEAAQKRLQAILEATELGAGFQVAMRDLEIRGAGNLLGAEQSGHVAAVGFDLYTRLLSQAVEKLRAGRGQTSELKRLTAEWKQSQLEMQGPAPLTLDLPLSAYLPTDYVADAEVRLQVYRRMADIRTTRQIQEMGQELRDRFGPLPEPANTLLDMLRLRVLGLRAGVERIYMEGSRLIIALPEGTRPTLVELPSWVRQRLQLRAHMIWLECGDLGERWREVLQRLLVALAAPEGKG